ncbi:MAG: hypothetical protein ACTHLU_10365 [Novosphingobium sp.]
MRELALIVASVVAAPAALAETAAFSPPEGPVTLTRTVRRALPDGKEVVATRSYELRIVRDGDGYRVDGQLLSADVQAPPSLEGLAAIERKRSDDGLFPFRLDARGMIAPAPAAGDRASLEAAGAATRRAIAGGPLPPAQQREAQGFVRRIMAGGAAGAGAQWPADLFRPVFGRRVSSSPVSLAGGRSGTVTTTIEAARRDGTDRIERTVVTETGGNRRTTREIYALVPSPE